MTIDEIMKALYFKKQAYFLDMFGKVKCNRTTLYSDRNNCTNNKHIQKWLAINDLLNVATYFNASWVPDWANGEEKKYTIVRKNGVYVSQQVQEPVSIVYFSSEQDARCVIEVMGKTLLDEIFA